MDRILIFILRTALYVYLGRLKRREDVSSLYAIKLERTLGVKDPDLIAQLDFHFQSCIDVLMSHLYSIPCSAEGSTCLSGTDFVPTAKP